MLVSYSQKTIRRLSLLLWILNLGLAVAFTWSLLSDLGSRQKDRSQIAEFYRQAHADLLRLMSGLSRVQLRDTSGDRLRHVAVVSRQLRPKLPPAVEPASEEEASESEQGVEFAEGGPLAENWEYAGGIFIADDPSRSRVWLRKKRDPKTARSRYSSRNRLLLRRSRGTRYVRGRSRSRRTTQRRANKEIISFYAAQERFEDEELKLEFLIRSVNWNEIVYARPEAPEKEYVLERIGSSPYSFWEEKRLTSSAEATKRAEEDDDKEKHFRIRAAGYVDRVEEDYQRLLRGDDPDPHLDLE